MQLPPGISAGSGLGGSNAASSGMMAVGALLGLAWGPQTLRAIAVLEGPPSGRQP